ncbi:hypothetical protein [Mycobacteroides abscessus]|uniref:hypothetical protein n=1 Tax=Mycobacteroides abscessus TaxID=36809 RepID=UPI0010486183|nr:hypothetical protein [Mycobacteroides abscessus]
MVSARAESRLRQALISSRHRGLAQLPAAGRSARTGEPDAEIAVELAPVHCYVPRQSYSAHERHEDLRLAAAMLGAAAELLCESCGVDMKHLADEVSRIAANVLSFARVPR